MCKEVFRNIKGKIHARIVQEVQNESQNKQKFGQSFTRVSWRVSRLPKSFPAAPKRTNLSSSKETRVFGGSDFEGPEVAGSRRVRVALRQRRQVQPELLRPDVWRQQLDGLHLGGRPQRLGRVERRRLSAARRDGERRRRRRVVRADARQVAPRLKDAFGQMNSMSGFRFLTELSFVKNQHQQLAT